MALSRRMARRWSSTKAATFSDPAAAAAVGVLALLVYLRTLLPDVGGPEDTPKFQYLGAALGTAHPPGYPLHTMLSHVFSYLPVGTLAYRANLLSAVAGAAASATTWLLSRALGASRVAATFGALTMAFGAAFWTYSVLAEVYTLSAVLLLAVMFWLVRWKQTRRAAHLYAAAGCFALALGNHLAIVACVPAIALFLLVTDARSVMRPRTLATAGAIAVSGFLQYAYILVRTRQHTPYREATAHNVTELLRVIRGGDYAEYLFALGWAQLVDRLGEFQHLVAAELGVVGLLCAGAGVIVLMTRDWRVTALLGLSFAGIALFVLNIVGDLRGFLVVPLALASPFVATGGERVRLLAKRFGPGAAAAVMLLLLAYPLWPLRGNFEANDWSERTQEARFFRSWFDRLPARAAVLPEDYIADSIVVYLEVESRRRRTILQPRPHAASVRALFESGEHIYALNARHAELAPRGFHFVPLRLPPDAQHATAADRQPRRVYRLVGTLETLPFGDARWHDVTTVARQGRVSILIDNYRPFEARLVLYAAADAPLNPELTDDYVSSIATPTIEVRKFDRQDGASRRALAQSLAGDEGAAAILQETRRYVVRVECRVNDGGQFAAWGLSLGGAPRQVLGLAQPDRPHPSRAVISELPPALGAR